MLSLVRCGGAVPNSAYDYVQSFYANDVKLSYLKRHIIHDSYTLCHIRTQLIKVIPIMMATNGLSHKQHDAIRVIGGMGVCDYCGLYKIQSESCKTCSGENI